MNNYRIKFNFSFYYQLSLGVVAFLIAFKPKLIALGFLFLVGVTIYGIIKKQMKFVFNPILLGFILFYMAYGVGAIFTHNPALAGRYLEYKMSFVLVPMLFSFMPTSNIRITFPIIGLCLGVVFISIKGIIQAISIYSHTGNALTAFTSSNICIDHPTYYAVFVMISMVGVWHLFKLKTPRFYSYWIYPYLIFGTCMLFLSYSIAAILFFLILVSFVLLRFIYFKINKWVSVSLLLLAPIFLFYTVTNIPAFKDEIKNTLDAFHSYYSNPDKFVNDTKNHASGDHVRLIMWTVTWQEIKSHPFGVGTGNVDEFLSAGLTRNGQNELAKKDAKNEIKYNPHNQFLQTTLEIGVFGIVIFLVLLFKSLQIGVRNMNLILIVLITNLFFNSLFESMLQRQSGIVFYVFWICLLVTEAHVKKSRLYERFSSHTL
jgi:O-antigen ligase